jgi:hypothetical protein
MRGGSKPPRRAGAIEVESPRRLLEVDQEMAGKARGDMGPLASRGLRAGSAASLQCGSYRAR